MLVNQSRAASRYGLGHQAEMDLFHARERLAWSPPGINQSPPGINAMSERRLEQGSDMECAQGVHHVYTMQD